MTREEEGATMMDDIPSLVHILANPSYEPVASSVPSLWWTEAKHLCNSSVLSWEVCLLPVRGRAMRWRQSSHSSPVRWRLCCWGRPGRPLWCSGAAPAGWSWSWSSRWGSRCGRWSRPSWTANTGWRSNSSNLNSWKYSESNAQKQKRWDPPGGQQIADGVPGTDKDFRLVASQHRGFTGWYLYIYIRLHRLPVVIWGECTPLELLRNPQNQDSRLQREHDLLNMNRYINYWDFSVYRIKIIIFEFRRQLYTFPLTSTSSSCCHLIKFL